MPEWAYRRIHSLSTVHCSLSTEKVTLREHLISHSFKNNAVTASPQGEAIGTAITYQQERGIIPDPLPAKVSVI